MCKWFSRLAVPVTVIFFLKIFLFYVIVICELILDPPQSLNKVEHISEATKTNHIVLYCIISHRIIADSVVWICCLMNWNHVVWNPEVHTFIFLVWLHGSVWGWVCWCFYCYWVLIARIQHSLEDILMESYIQTLH